MAINKLNHLAIIMDGNGRWAKKRHLPRVMGHRKGMDNVEKIALAANKLGIKVLSLYAFSTENWARPHDEVNYIMNLPIRFFDRFMPELMANNVRVNVMGYLEELPAATYQVVKRAMSETRENDGLVLNFAFNYGARREISSAVRKLATLAAAGDLDPEQINEDMISQSLMTAQFGEYSDPDLLIRTSGEQRISNFLLWQLAYTELAFTDKYWPDFSPEDLEMFIKEYQTRDRRFGKLNETEAKK
jgi:undecaprenyl diphosphate synthase